MPENNRGAGRNASEKKQLILSNNLLIIGIDKYSGGFSPLKNPVRDALAFKELMTQKYRLDNSKITFLDDDKATKKNILHTFEKLEANLTESDNLIIYFAGHGELKEGHNVDRGYWIPVDAVAEDRSTYLPNDEVRDFIANLKAYHVFAIVDSCFSGSLVTRSSNQAVKRYYNMPSRWIMTSGMKEPVADGSGQHSPFSKSLLTYLSNSQKEAIGINDLWVHMRTAVVSNAKQSPLCQPMSNVGHQNGEFFFLTTNPENLPDEIVDGGDVDNSQSRGNSEVVNPAPVANNAPAAQISTLADYKKQLKMLIAQTKIKEVLEKLLTDMSEDASGQETVYLRSGQFHSIQEKLALGTLADATTQMAQIKSALMYVIDNLEEEDLNVSLGS